MTPFYRLFDDAWEYLDFKRQKREVSRTSPNGLLSASIENHGSSLTYILTAGEKSKISVSLQRFRATSSRLREFHVGCARVVRNMKRYLRTQDPKWLKADRPFGQLHGGVVLSDGNVMCRGNNDDIDSDEWIDMVEDESLARLLDQVDRMTRDFSGQNDEAIQRQRAWGLLETIPEQHEFHVEVLRRRLLLIYGNEEFKELPKAVRWATALVEAEPYEVTNWWWLDDAVERLEGKSAAVEVLRKGLKSHGPNFTLYYGLASHLCALDRLDEAKEAMLLALTDDPCAIDSALASNSFLAIRDFILEQKNSDWYAPTREYLKGQDRQVEITG
jgi:tetratricopeptide (TPR) repeat protein